MIEELNLPPLPLPQARLYTQGRYRRASVLPGKGDPLFDTASMQAFARQAVEADRASRPAVSPQSSDVDDARDWTPLTGPGQIVPGDLLRFTTGDKQRVETARLVLEAGTDGEEVVYDVAKNWYFITSMAVVGESYAKKVEYRAAMSRTAKEP